MKLLTILITGSREWTDRDRIIATLERYRKLAAETDHVLLVLHGDCPTGADRIVRRETHRMRIHAAAVDALWDMEDGGTDRSAGVVRNAVMVAMKPQVGIAFYGGGKSTGTKDCVRRLRDADIPVEEFVP